MPTVPLQAGIEIVDLSSRTPIIIIITNGGELCCSLPRANVKQSSILVCLVVGSQPR